MGEAIVATNNIAIVDVDVDVDDDEMVGSGDVVGGTSGGGGGDNDGVSEEDVSNLTRLAFACEVGKKKPLKREDIINLVLGGNSRNIRQLLVKTNERLKSVFGMQLIALPTISRAINTMTAAGRKAMTIRKVKDTPSVGTFYILISSLEAKRTFINHRSPDRLAMLMVILSMITLSENNEIEEEILFEKLEALGVNKDNVNHTGSLTDWLIELRRQKYIISAKKNDDMNVTVYSIGPRALLEFPSDTLASFIIELGQSLQQDVNLLLEHQVNAAFKIKP